MFEDVKGVLRSSPSTKDRQYNDQKKKTDRRTNNDLQNTTQKTQNWTKTAGALVCSQKVSSSYRKGNQKWTIEKKLATLGTQDTGRRETKKNKKTPHYMHTQIT
jgi:hypothetical protein